LVPLVTTPIAQAIGLDFFSRPTDDHALVLAPAAQLAAIRTDVTERWRSLKAAMSSGIAHADSPSAEAEQRLSTLEHRTIAFASFDDPPALPPTTSIAYVVGTPSQAWLAVLAHTTIVNIS
jgi:hypothetical protein